MLMLNKTVFVVMVAFMAAVVFGAFFVPYMREKKMEQNVSKFLPQHKKKNHTPTLGGLIFIIPSIFVTIVLCLFGMIEFSYNLVILITVFLGYGLIGFLDDMKKIKEKNNKGLSRIAKFSMQLVIALAFFLIYTKSGSDPVLWIYTLGIKINLGWFYGVFILIMLVGMSNAVNLTDGLDGLAGGLSFLALAAYGLITWGATWLEGNQSLAMFCFIICGGILAFMGSNMNPAKIFMGDTGALALGGVLATIAILTSHELTLFVVGGVFIAEALSAVIQIIAIRVFKKRVFKMAPLHHHFEKLGWEEKDIVHLFWGVGLVLCMAALAFGVWI